MPGNVVPKPNPLVVEYPRMTVKHLVFLKYIHDKNRGVHGAELARAFCINNGTIYPTLGRMVEEGMLTEKIVRVRHEPDRIVYKPSVLGARLMHRVLDLLMRADEVEDQLDHELSLG